MAQLLAGDPQAVKEVLETDGIEIVEDNINAFLQESLNAFNLEMAFLFGPEDFPLDNTTLKAPFFETGVSIINELTRGKFWLEGNSDSTVYDTAVKKLVEYRKTLYRTIGTNISD